MELPSPGGDNTTGVIITFVVFFITTVQIFNDPLHVTHGAGVGMFELGVRTPTSKSSSLGLNPDPARNCHTAVSQAGWFINVCRPSDGR